MAVRGSASSAEIGDAGEPLPAPGRRLARAAGVAGLWVVATLPVALGGQRCLLAALFHRPCPGCGLTRAVRLLVAGRFDASWKMHPLALPVLVAGALLVASTVWATFSGGSPAHLHRTRLGRGALALAVAVYGATIVLWVLRGFGCFGGPVPV
jgi:hypothetical protein